MAGVSPRPCTTCAKPTRTHNGVCPECAPSRKSSWGKKLVDCALCARQMRHYAKGLCRPCYARKAEGRVAECSDCRESRVHFAKGRCHDCYNAYYLSNKGPEINTARRLKWATDDAHAARLRERNRRYGLARHHGVTPEQVAALVEAGGNQCEICARPFSPSCRPRIDHCHRAGHLRGLLCNQCNIGLGHFNDNPHTLHSAVAYLARHKTPPRQAEKP